MIKDVPFSENLGQGEEGITIAAWVNFDSLSGLISQILKAENTTTLEFVSLELVSEENAQQETKKKLRYSSSLSNDPLAVQTVITDTEVVQLQTFTHVAAVVFNTINPGNSVKLYVNAQVVKEAVLPASSFPRDIARDVREIGDNFRGLMRDVVGFNVALSQQEIALLMRRELEIIS